MNGRVKSKDICRWESDEEWSNIHSNGGQICPTQRIHSGTHESPTSIELVFLLLNTIQRAHALLGVCVVCSLKSVVPVRKIMR